MAEQWTRERRRQHTQEVLIDAAEKVFAERGFEGTSLEEIAAASGYSRATIYKVFGGKTELFNAVHKRTNERFLEGFREAMEVWADPEDVDVAELARRWREMQTVDARAYTLGAEFMLYVLRNPDVKEQVVQERREVTEMIARFIEDQTRRLGRKPKIPTLTLARIAVAASDGLALAARMDPEADDLYESFIQLLISAWEEEPQNSSISSGSDESGGA